MLEVPRTTPRALWYWLYRRYRVLRREVAKAHTDVMIYGTGALFVSVEGPKHVPFTELQDQTKWLAS